MEDLAELPELPHTSENAASDLQDQIQKLKMDYSKQQSLYEDKFERKNKELDIQRVKIKQLEFAVQEAMIYLAKPLGKYDEWLTSDNHDDFDIQFNKNIPSAKSVQESIVTKHSKSVSTPTVPSMMDQNKNKSSPEFSNLEIKCLESMRMCFNFLKNCEKYNRAVENGTYEIPKPTQLDSNISESTIILKPPPAASESSTLKINTNNDSENDAKQMKKASSKHKIEDINEEGDLSSPLLEEQTSVISKGQCEKCHKNLLLVDSIRDQSKKLAKEKEQLSTKLENEIKARKVAQQAKDMMDVEIEEITAELFARANQMVIDESKAKDDLQTNNRELSKNLADMTNRLKEKEQELSEATKYLYELQGTQLNTNLFSNQPTALHGRSHSKTIGGAPPNLQIREPVRAASMNNDMVKSPTISTFTHAIYSGFETFGTPSVAVDGIIFQEFQDFMRAVVLSATQVSTTAFQSIHGTLFMKRMLLESIEPCLYYTYQPNNQFKHLGTTLPATLKKRLLDLSIRGHLEVVPMSYFDSKVPSNPIKVKCLMCTLNRECEYQIKIGPQESKQDVAPLCRFCRDRILTVTDFFSYVALLASGSGSSTILSTFRHILWLKRRMALAMVGSCSLFETEITAILGPGRSGDWEKSTDIVY